MHHIYNPQGLRFIETNKNNNPSIGQIWLADRNQGSAADAKFTVSILFIYLFIYSVCVCVFSDFPAWLGKR